MPTARWVLPTPMLPISSKPVLSSGYSSTNLQAAMRAVDKARCGPSKSKLESSQCSYRLGIRADASSACARSWSLQSQRVTRRSEPTDTDFHPVPSHLGQTAVATFAGMHLDCASGGGVRASAIGEAAVQMLWRYGSGCGEQRKKTA